MVEVKQDSEVIRGCLNGPVERFDVFVEPPGGHTGIQYLIWHPTSLTPRDSSRHLVQKDCALGLRRGCALRVAAVTGRIGLERQPSATSVSSS